MEKEALQIMAEDDEDLMEISGSNFTPRKRRHVKVREQLDDSFVRRSKRLTAKRAGYKDAKTAKNAAAVPESEAVIEPLPLATIPPPGPAPFLNKDVAHGIAEGFLQIHPSVASASLLDEEIENDKSI